MHTRFLLFLVLFLSFSNLFSAKNDKATLLKIKAQMGNPIELNSWVPATDYCGWSGEHSYSYIACNGNHRVKTLYIGYFNVNATFPHAIFDLIELESLDVSYIEGLYGEIPCGIANLPHLRTLAIRYTSVSGPIPSSLGETNTNLTAIRLEHNKLSGPIPESISKLKNLNFLLLGYNQLTGPIPSELVHDVPSLPTYLDLSYNDLSGELPNYYGSVHFTEINLRNNRLSGDVSFMFGIGKSVMIFFANNNFSFDLSNIEASNNLNALDLSNNKIWGSIPQWMENIMSFNLSNNQLCGPIPSGSYSMDHFPELYANNACLCGGPLPPCSN